MKVSVADEEGRVANFGLDPRENVFQFKQRIAPHVAKNNQVWKFQPSKHKTVP